MKRKGVRKGRNRAKDRTATILHDIYYDPKSPGSFASIEKLFTEAKKRGLKVSRDQVKDWLLDQESYTLHAPAVRKNVTTQPIVVSGSNKQWEADLYTVETTFQKENAPIKFILFVVDSFSKEGWARPLKTKRPREVLPALESIFEASGQVPSVVRSDQGKEFQNEAFWKERGITHVQAIAPQKASMAERLIKTISEKIERYLTAKQGTDKRYIDKLDGFMHSYNNTLHSTHRMNPEDAKEMANAAEVSDRLYRGQGRYKDVVERELVDSTKRDDLRVGDHVRLAKAKATFEKGRKSNFTREIFKVAKRRRADHLVLEDYLGEPIKGRVYRREVQSVKGYPDVYKVQVLQKKGAKVFVHWVGYPTSMDQWISTDDLQQPDVLDPTKG